MPIDKSRLLDCWRFAIQVFWPFGALAIVLTLYFLFPPTPSKDTSQTIVVPERETLSGIFTIDVFAPFDLDALYDRKMPPGSEDTWPSWEERYGKPVDVYRSSNRHSRVLQRYWDGEHGTVAICEFETSEDAVERSIDLYPDSLRLNDVVRAKYLEEIKPREGEWSLCFNGENYSLFLLLELDGESITSISLSY